MLIVTCAYDTLAHEAEEYADRIGKLASKNLVTKRVPGVDHDWYKEIAPGREEEGRGICYLC